MKHIKSIFFFQEAYLNAKKVYIENTCLITKLVIIDIVLS